MTEHWTWPANTSIVLFHWSWARSGPHDLIHGWSQQPETDDAGYIHLEEELDSAAATLQVNPDGYPSTRRHTFRSLAELPSELTDDAGLPLPWVRALIEARAARWH